MVLSKLNNIEVIAVLNRNNRIIEINIYGNLLYDMDDISHRENKY